VNPALPVLALLTAGGALLGRRERGLPWAALGLAGIALLAPALRLPTGVPSPAASLATLPPWQGAASSGNPAGNPLLRDVTFQIEPWLLYLRHELRAGRLPFWNPHQSSGAPFWGNGQSAPLFPLHLLFAALPLGIGLTLLPWLRLMIGGGGAWALARELGLSRPAALLAALTFPLAGMTVSFLLFPMGNALALVPWVFWAVERIAREGGAIPVNAEGFAVPVAVASPAIVTGGVLALAVAGGLQLLAGHPETAAHTALLSVLYLLVRLPWRGSLCAWLGLAAGWAVAALVAGVEILPVAFTLPLTSRWQLHLTGPEPALRLLAEQPLRLVLPQLYGHPAAGTWWGPFNYSATAVYAGALVLPLAAVGLAGVRSDRRLRAVAAVVAFSFLAAYHLPGLRDLIGALPLVGRAPLHRLLFGVELGLALLTGAGLDRWLAGRGARLVWGGAGAVAVLLSVSWALFARDWAAHGLIPEEAAWTALAAAVALLLALSSRLSPARRRAVGLLLPAFAVCDLLAAHGAINPGLALERLYPETGAVRFLAGQEGRVAGTGQALRPNAAMVYGLADPRGDDPVKIASYEAVYGSLATPDPVYYQPIVHWSDPWLDRLGVRWVLTGPAEPPPLPGWRMAYAGQDGRVYERPGALPLVRWERSGEGQVVRVVRRQPGSWAIDWSTPRPDRLVIAETAVPGWQAASGGWPLPLTPASGLLVGVPLGPGGGRVEVTYRPPGVAAGALASLLGILALAALAVWRPGKPA
jgi:hypothetical protein